MSPAEMAAHNGQRQRLATHCNNLVTLFAEQTFPLMKKRHSAAVNWFLQATRHMRLLHTIASSTRALKRGRIKIFKKYIFFKSIKKFLKKLSKLKHRQRLQGLFNFLSYRLAKR